MDVGVVDENLLKCVFFAFRRRAGTSPRAWTSEADALPTSARRTRKPLTEKTHASRSMPVALPAARQKRGAAAAALFSLSLALSAPAAAFAQEGVDLPPCPSIALDDVRVLAAPCSDPAMACDLDSGCIGAVISYVGTRVDLTSFEEAPPAEYVADCVAPFALSEEVTSTIPQETLGAMIACDFDAVTARFERDFAPAPATATATAPAPA